MKNTMQRYNNSCNLQEFYIEITLFLNFVKPFTIPFKLPLH